MGGIAAVRQSDRLVEFSAKARARRYFAPRPARNAATPFCLTSHGARIHTSRSSFCRIERQNSSGASAYAATSRPVFPILGRLRRADVLCECPLIGVDRKSLADRQNDANDPQQMLICQCWCTPPLSSIHDRMRFQRKWLGRNSMVAYVIFDVDIRDPKQYQEFMSGVKPALETAGAKYLARGGAHKVYEGDWEPRRIVLFEFPSVAAYESFYNGATYQGLKSIRDACSSARMVIVEGLE